MNADAKQSVKHSRRPAEGRKDFCVLSDSAAGPALLFENPQELIDCAASVDPTEALCRLDRACATGLYVAGYFCYEALPFENGAFEPPAPWPALRFGVFEAPRELETDEVLQFLGNEAYSLRPLDSNKEQSRDRFFEAVGLIKAALARGDCYQINYTDRSEFEFEGDVRALYARLRALQPTAMAALVLDGDLAVLSLSPELFVAARSASNGLQLETRPMKGTAPRRFDGELDQQERDRLQSDPKTRAENLMIVDLLRNDLGIRARPGSVEATDLFSVETHATLHQMTGTVRAFVGPADAGRFFERVFPGLFPSGSVTGAPKLAARRLIEALEVGPRGVYTGSVGYASGETITLNVAIRTLTVDRAAGRAVYGSGCGIVFDSDPQSEWKEYELKRAFLEPTVDGFHLIETMRVKAGRITLIENHLDRMQSSAIALGLEFPEDRVGRALQAAAEQVHDGRLRLQLFRNAEFRIEAGSAGVISGKRSGARFLLPRADEQVWSADPFRRHKTGLRALYDRAFFEAREAGFLDAYFLNERGHIVETATGNLLFYDPRKRVWISPSADSGCLPGTLLAALEARRPGRIRRVPLPYGDLADLRAFVLNSVRGLNPVQLLADTLSTIRAEPDRI